MPGYRIASIIKLQLFRIVLCCFYHLEYFVRICILQYTIRPLQFYFVVCAHLCRDWANAMNLCMVERGRPDNWAESGRGGPAGEVGIPVCFGSFHNMV